MLEMRSALSTIGLANSHARLRSAGEVRCGQCSASEVRGGQRNAGEVRGSS